MIPIPTTQDIEPVVDFRDEPIFIRSRAGLPLDELVIDAHGHLGSWRQFAIPQSDAAGLVKVMDRCGVRGDRDQRDAEYWTRL